MNKKLCVLAATLAAVAGCAAPPATRVAASSSPSYYCVKENLLASGDRLQCNWQPTADEACKFADVSVMERGSFSSDPQPAGRCNTGQWLVRVTRR